MGQRNIDHWKTLPSRIVKTMTENASLCDSDFFKYSHKLLREFCDRVQVQSNVESPVLEVES